MVCRVPDEYKDVESGFVLYSGALYEWNLAIGRPCIVWIFWMVRLVIDVTCDIDASGIFMDNLEYSSMNGITW